MQIYTYLIWLIFQKFSILHRSPDILEKILIDLFKNVLKLTFAFYQKITLLISRLETFSN